MTQIPANPPRLLPTPPTLNTPELNTPELDTPHVPQLTLQYGGLRFRPHPHLLSGLTVDHWQLDLSSGVLLLSGQPYEAAPQQRRRQFTDTLAEAITAQLPVLRAQLDATLCGKTLPARRRERLPLRAALAISDLSFTALHVGGALSSRRHNFTWDLPTTQRNLSYWTEKTADLLRQHRKKNTFFSRRDDPHFPLRDWRSADRARITAQLTNTTSRWLSETSSKAMRNYRTPHVTLDFSPSKDVLTLLPVDGQDLDTQLLKIAGMAREAALMNLSGNDIRALSPRLNGSALLAGVSPWLRTPLLQALKDESHNPLGLQDIPAGPRRDAFALVGKGDHELMVIAALTAQKPEELVDLKFARALNALLSKPAKLIDYAHSAACHAVNISYELIDDDSSLPPEVFTAASEWRVGRRAQLDETELAERRAALTQAPGEDFNWTLLIPGLSSHERRVQELREQRQALQDEQVAQLTALGIPAHLAVAAIGHGSFPPEAPAGEPGWDAELRLGEHLIEARVLRSAGALREESSAMNHCIGYGGYTDRCARGVARAVHFSGGPVNFTLLLRKDVPGNAEPDAPLNWHAEEYKRPHNAALSEVELQVLRTYLRLIGALPDQRLPAGRAGIPAARRPVPVTDLTAEQREQAAPILSRVVTVPLAPAIRARAKTKARSRQGSRELAELYAAKITALTGSQVLILHEGSSGPHLNSRYGAPLLLPDLSHWDPEGSTTLLTYNDEYMDDHYAREILPGQLHNLSRQTTLNIRLINCDGLRVVPGHVQTESIGTFEDLTGGVPDLLTALLAARRHEAHPAILPGDHAP